MKTCRDYNQNILNKKCNVCLKVKKLEWFTTKVGAKYGHYSQCKKCVSEKVKIYYKINRKKRLAYTKKWAKENRDIINKASRRYYKRNKEKHLILVKHRRARALKAEGSFTKQEWEDLKKKYNYSCAICGLSEPFNQYRKWLTLDHIQPLSKGGTNYIMNIQPLCFVCNSVKKDKGIVRTYRKL